MVVLYFFVYNYCMRKFKIITTIFIIYEFLVIMVLHRQSYCNMFFDLIFCEYGAYRYFFMCVMVPVLTFVILWWLSSISCKKTCDIEKDLSPDNTITRGDIEYFVSSLLLIIMQHFFKKHKKTESVFMDILNAMKQSRGKR